MHNQDYSRKGFTKTYDTYLFFRTQRLKHKARNSVSGKVGCCVTTISTDSIMFTNRGITLLVQSTQFLEQLCKLITISGSAKCIDRV